MPWLCIKSEEGGGYAYFLSLNGLNKSEHESNINYIRLRTAEEKCKNSEQTFCHAHQNLPMKSTYRTARSSGDG